MKKIILFILFAVTIQAQTYNVGQTNANISSALSQALAQPDSNTVYRNAINLKFNITDTTVFVSDALLDALLAYKLNVADTVGNYALYKALALAEATTKIDTMASDTLDFTATQINALLNMLNSIPSDSTTVGSGEIYFNASDGIIRRKY